MPETLDRSARRLAALYAADRILASAPTVEDAAPKILAELGRSEGWLIGHLWLVDPRHHVLRWGGGWHVEHRDFAEFTAQSRGMVFPPEHGVLGKVWAAGTPRWLHDLAKEPAFVRRDAAAKEGLRSGLIFPIWNMDHVVGVIEYYGAQHRRPSESQIALVTSVGQELGLFVEYKRALEDARRTTAILRAQQEAAIDGILVVDEHQAVVSYNARFQAMWGVPDAVMAVRDDRVIQAHVRPLLVDAEAYMARVAQLYLAPLEAGHDEIRLADGRVFDRYTAPAIAPNGQYVGRVWYLRDVTAERRAADQLARLAAIVEASSDAIYGITTDGVITSWNDGAERLLGHKAADVVCTPARRLFPPEQAAELEGHVARLRAGEHVTLLEAVHLRADGSRAEVSVTFSPIRDAAGQVVGAAAIARDLSELSRMRREVQAQYEQLIESNRLKNMFVNAVTHELRTPLTAMKGYLEFLEEGQGGPLTAKEQEFVREIMRGEERLERLVTDLLDFARLEAGTFKLSCEVADVGARLAEVVESLRPLALHARVRLDLDLPSEPVEAVLDPQRVGQVLINLVGNAVKFTPEGGTITVRVRRRDGVVRVEVADTGVGIAPEDVPKLFQRFVQLDAGVRKGGTGLGLSISKTLIEAHGGRIGVESTPGRGSVFWFELPAAGGCPLG